MHLILLAAEAPGANDPLEYLPVFLLMLIAISLAGVMLVASWLVGKRGTSNPAKESAYECGIEAEGDAHTRFSVKFYLVAVLFILFDVEVIFLYPWAVYFGGGSAPEVFGSQAAFRQFLFAEMLVFIVILFLGWYWVVKKKALDWGHA
jgi:NADH-quinone oxidoreductase subunit A